MNKGIGISAKYLDGHTWRSTQVLNFSGGFSDLVKTGALRLMLRVAVWSAVAMTLIGCANTKHQSDGNRLSLAPSALGESINLHQHLRVERNGRADEIDVALEVDSQHIDLVGLAMGQRVMTLHYDGKTLQSWRHMMLPPQVRAEDVLEDLQLAFWPSVAVRQALPSGWRLEENDLHRTFFLGEDKVIEILYSGRPRWIGTIKMTNLRYGYRLNIQSISTSP